MAAATVEEVAEVLHLLVLVAPTFSESHGSDNQ